MLEQFESLEIKIHRRVLTVLESPDFHVALDGRSIEGRFLELFPAFEADPPKQSMFTTDGAWQITSKPFRTFGKSWLFFSLSS